VPVVADSVMAGSVAVAVPSVVALPLDALRLIDANAPVAVADVSADPDPLAALMETDARLPEVEAVPLDVADVAESARDCNVPVASAPMPALALPDAADNVTDALDAVASAVAETDADGAEIDSGGRPVVASDVG